MSTASSVRKIVIIKIFPQYLEENVLRACEIQRSLACPFAQAVCAFPCCCVPSRSQMSQTSPWTMGPASAKDSSRMHVWSKCLCCYSRAVGLLTSFLGLAPTAPGTAEWMGPGSVTAAGEAQAAAPPRHSFLLETAL